MNRAKIIPMIELDRTYHNRIFTRGRNSKGRKIGSYSTNPMYVSIAAQKKKTGSQIRNSGLKPQGKDGSKQFKSGKKKRSMYLKSGYSEFRQVVGRQNRFVDFNLTGNLSASIGHGTTRKGAALGFLNEDSLRLAQQLEEKYGPVFDVSKREEQKAIEQGEQILIDAVLKALR